ncbi:DUF6326 family protein [Shimia ponticola]|uniref:DUF6326 family protein n=1 Tax=Shimia ponticola TaxID=2582893 RepID=UPI0011BE3FD5|nr:DUF6326 family protein [Shimia ponticola]
MPLPFQTRIAVSFLWCFVALNMAFADVLSIYTPGTVPQLMNGTIEGVALSETLMLIAAVMLQIAMVMIVATQFLPDKWCRIVNSVAVIVTAAFVIGGGSLKPHYIFFAVSEVAAMATVLVLMWRREPQLVAD